MLKRTSLYRAALLAPLLASALAPALAEPDDPYASALADVIRLADVELAPTNRNLRTEQTIRESGHCELERTDKSFTPDGNLSTVLVTTYPVSRIDPSTIAERDWAGVGFKAVEGSTFYARFALGRGDSFKPYSSNINVETHNKSAFADALKALVDAC